MPKLVVITPGLGDQSHVLSENLTTIGRADGNTIQLKEASVSGRHCEVQLRGNELLVRDLYSTNGTFIMGQRITEGTLRLGQILRLGQVELRLQVAVPVVAPVYPSIGASLISASKRPAPKVESQKNPLPELQKPAGLETGASPTVPSVAVPTIQQMPVSKPLSAAIPAPPRPGALPKRHVLFVDDNTPFLETMSRLFEVLAHGSWEIHCTSAPDRALKLLQELPIDLVVTDLGMPMLDGMQLLGLIQRRYPGLKKAVLTSQADETTRGICLARGADLVIEKPVAVEGFEAAFNLLNELLALPQRDGFSGVLREVGLPDVIQMKCLMRSSTLLEIRNRQMSGQIYIENGEIVHATAGVLSGEQALYKLLSLSGGEFKASPFTSPAQRTIQGQWEPLLMEAARLRDETAVIVLDDTKTRIPKRTVREKVGFEF